MSSDSSTLYRNNPSNKTSSSTEDEIISNRRSTLKETDLDNINMTSGERYDGTLSNIKTLSINRNPANLSPLAFQNEQYQETNKFLNTTQRRSSFQAATQLNSLDFYTTSDRFYFLDKNVIKPTPRNHYSPERDLRERENYREKRRDYSLYSKPDFNRQSSTQYENRISTNENLNTINSNNDQQLHEINAINEYNRENSRNDNTIILNNDDRNEDRYRDDGIFV